MSNKRILLCTDMDRTVLPNGVQSESKYARKRFAAFAAQPEVTLVYVTGRHRALTEDAIRKYCLPKPDYAITDVGTCIYHVNENEWQSLQEWQEEIDKDWGGKNSLQIREMLRDIISLQLQETSKQNTHKLSYYVALHVDHVALLAQIDNRLKDQDIHASLIWSVDEPKGIGLLDVLPENATKLHAVQFLRQLLGFELDEMVFAGDSGNDLPVLTSPIPSVLVANASNEVKAAAVELSKRYQNSEALYIANGQYLGMNGNYAAGVLEGIWHYAPDFRDKLKTL